MRKSILGLLILFILTTDITLAQGRINDIDAVKPVKYQEQLMQSLSPQSATFQKYINHEISETSGVPMIEIPLYEIRLNQMKIPVVLSYDASGIRYRQDDGEVGVGWSLSVGGYRIIKEIRGRDDFKELDRYDPDKHTSLTDSYQKGSYPGYFMNSYNASFSYGNSQRSELNSTFTYTEHNAQDGEKDLYSYMLPTVNGKYIIPGKTPYATQSFNLINNNLKVDFLYKKSWSITDNKGNVFFLGGDEVSKISHEIYKDPIYITIDPKSATANGSTNYTQAWLLRKINTICNETVELDYMAVAKKLHYESGSLSQTDAALYVKDNDRALTNISSNGSDLTSDEPRYSDQGTVDAAYITQIKTNYEIIYFKRGVQINGHLIAHLLNSIEVRDLNNNLIKKVKFNYIYTSPNKIRNPYDETMHQRAPYHVLLTSVSIGSDTKDNDIYTLEYNIPSSMRGAAPDQWGYYVRSLMSFQYDIDDTAPLNYSKKGYIYSPIHTLLKDETDRLQEQELKIKTKQGDGMVPIETPRPEDIETDRESIYNIQGNNNLFVSRNPNPDDTKLFILTKINNPLGGYTQYEYEPNKCIIKTRDYISDPLSNKLANGAGVRIKKIISKSNSETPDFITNYYYSGPTTKGNIKDFNILRFFSGYHYTLGLRGVAQYEYSSDVTEKLYYKNNVKIARSFFSSSNVEKFSEASRVFYQQVTKVQTDDKGETLGKIVSEYSIPKQFIYGLYAFTQSYGYIPANAKLYALYSSLPKEKNILPKDFSHHIYLQYYNINDNPNILNRVYLNAQGDTLKTEEYKYSTINENQEERGYKTKQLVTLPELFSDNPNREGKERENPIFEYGYPNIKFNYSVLSKKTVKEQMQNGSFINTIEDYSYDDQGRLKITKNYTNSPYPYEKEFIYPITNSTLYNKNMLSTVTGEIRKNNNKLISHTKDIYAEGQIWPTESQSSFDGNNFRTEATYKYNTNGNIVQYITLDNISTIILWSYLGQYPIAEIRGATYDQVESAVKAEFGVTNIDALSKLAIPDVAKLQKLRLNNNLSGAHVTTYTYQPLVGMTTMTNPTGVTITYEYDPFGRLKRTKDQNGKTIQEYDYHYRNQ